jgi:hypothetical protein
MVQVLFQPNLIDVGYPLDSKTRLSRPLIVYNKGPCLWLYARQLDLLRDRSLNHKPIIQGSAAHVINQRSQTGVVLGGAVHDKCQREGLYQIKYLCASDGLGTVTDV